MKSDIYIRTTKKLTAEIFINRSIEIHGTSFNYSLVDYINNKTKIKIICPSNHIFEQTPKNHLNGFGCHICFRENEKLTTEEFIKTSIIKHFNKYDYSISKYINGRTKIEIICKEHGIFKQIPNAHMNGQKCPKCSTNQKLSNEDFIIKSKNIHGGKYDYSKVNYIDNITKVIIICPEHGEYHQTPASHYKGRGCQMCNVTKGENEIIKYLKSKNIKYLYQHVFKDCKIKRKLPFDFYLPDYNICIEYDGIQHFEPVEAFGGIDTFNKTIITDNIKNEYCQNNNIKLIRIKYTSFEKVNNILDLEIY